jgi:phosphatidylethanolamine-binding protein (PEBP) family uncharacterized protein
MTSITVMYDNLLVSDNSYHNIENVQSLPTVIINKPEKNCNYAITLTDPDCSYPSYLHWFTADITDDNPTSLDSLTFVCFLASDVRNHHYIFTLYKYYDCQNKDFKLPLTMIGNNNFNTDIFAHINNIEIVCDLTYFVW